MAGMKAIVVKCHHQHGGGCPVARQAAPEVKTVGYITLNGTVGGSNPRSVKVSGFVRRRRGVAAHGGCSSTPKANKAGKGH